MKLTALFAESSDQGWIGVDLDGTLAYDSGFKGPEHIGRPIPKMVSRVKRWLTQGKKVKIFTARVDRDSKKVKAAIRAWCREHIGCELPITNKKDRWMIEFWDDKAISINKNKGTVI